MEIIKVLYIEQLQMPTEQGSQLQHFMTQQRNLRYLLYLTWLVSLSLHATARWYMGIMFHHGIQRALEGKETLMPF